MFRWAIYLYTIYNHNLFSIQCNECTSAPHIILNEISVYAICIRRELCFNGVSFGRSTFGGAIWGIAADIAEKHWSQQFCTLATILCVCRLHVFAIGFDALMLNSHLNHFQHPVSILHFGNRVWADIICPHIVYEYEMFSCSYHVSQQIFGNNMLNNEMETLTSSSSSTVVYIVLWSASLWLCLSH